MQASLVIVGGVLGLAAFLSTFDWRWLLGAVVLLANWPYTIIVIMPTNRRLTETPVDAATMETRGMIRRWGILHAGRSALGFAATLIFMWLGDEAAAGQRASKMTLKIHLQVQNRRWLAPFSIPVAKERKGRPARIALAGVLEHGYRALVPPPTLSGTCIWRI